MRKFNIWLCLLGSIIMFPFLVFAETEKEENKKEPIKIYEFYGDGCNFCASSFEYFTSLEDEYGDYFDLIKFEVWGSRENEALMNAVADGMGDNVSGVPYIIIGDYTLNGYSSSNNDDILNKIIEEYEKNVDERDNRAANIIDNFEYKDNSVVVVTILVLVVIGVVVIVVKARKD